MAKSAEHFRICPLFFRFSFFIFIFSSEELFRNEKCPIGSHESRPIFEVARQCRRLVESQTFGRPTPRDTLQSRAKRSADGGRDTPNPRPATARPLDRSGPGASVRRTVRHTQWPSRLLRGEPKRGRSVVGSRRFSLRTQNVGISFFCFFLFRNLESFAFPESKMTSRARERGWFFVSNFGVLGNSLFFRFFHFERFRSAQSTFFKKCWARASLSLSLSLHSASSRSLLIPVESSGFRVCSGR